MENPFRLRTDPGNQFPGFARVGGAHAERPPLPSVGLCGRDEKRAGLLVVNDVVGAGGNAGRVEAGQAEGALPGAASVIGMEDAADAGVNTVGANGQGEVGVCEVDAALAFLHRRDGYTRTGDTVQVSALGQQVPLRSRVLYRPGLAAIEASSQHRNLRLLAIDVVILTLVLVVAHPETDQDLVLPAPDAVVGRPAAEHALLEVDLDMHGFVGRHLLPAGRIRFIRGETGDHPDRQQP